MAYKTFTSGNMFYMISDSGKNYQAHAKNVMIRQPNENSDNYYVEGLVNLRSTMELSISDFKKEDGSDYTEAEFKTFIETELGKPSAAEAANQNEVVATSLVLLDTVNNNNYQLVSVNGVLVLNLIR